MTNLTATMKPMHNLIALGTLVLAFSLQPSAFSQGTAFNYQGRLNDGGSPANGIYDLRSSIYDAVTAGSQVGGTTTNAATAVSNGLLTVVLDFGPSVFDGSARWLELAVRTNGGGAFTTLSPRQALTPTPYAIAASNLTGFLPASRLTGSIPPGQLLGSYSNEVNFNNTANTFVGLFSGNGSGLTNVAGTFAWQLVAGTNIQATPNTGYMLTNPQPVTMTLPSSPNLGDIVRVSATGAGGWRISQNPGQRILNSYGSGETWRITSAPQGQWFPLASSADGAKLVAATAPAGQIWTSTDAGATWTMQTTVGRDWSALASSADGTRLVASVSGGRIWVSINSGNTFVTTSAPTTNWSCLASSANGSNLVAGVTGGQIFVSSDAGDTWTPHGPVHQWVALASSTDGARLIASGDSGVFTSANSGVSWTARSVGSPLTAGVASSADGSQLAVTTGGTANQGLIYVSTDYGVTWTGCGPSQNWVEIAMSADGTKLAAITYPGQIWVSTDSGANWAPHGPATYWNRIVSSSDGSRLVVDSGNIWISQSTTTLGTTGYLTGGQNSAIEIQYVGGGLFIPLSHEGNISQF